MEALLVFTSQAAIFSGCAGMQFDSAVSATFIALLLFCAESFTVSGPPAAAKNACLN
jgi:hypothetical protein